MTFSSEFYNEAWDKWDDMKVYGPTARHTRRFIFNFLHNLSFESVSGRRVRYRGFAQADIGKISHVKLTGSEYSARGLRSPGDAFPMPSFIPLIWQRTCWDSMIL
jgi:hypothetical protein